MTLNSLYVEISITKKIAYQLADTGIIAHTAWTPIQPKIALLARQSSDQTLSPFAINDSPLGVYPYLDLVFRNYCYLFLNHFLFR